MPLLTFQVPQSDWEVLEQHAKREGVSVRTLVLWKLKGEFGFPVKPPLPTVVPTPETEAA